MRDGQPSQTINHGYHADPPNREDRRSLGSQAAPCRGDGAYIISTKLISLLKYDSSPSQPKAWAPIVLRLALPWPCRLALGGRLGVVQRRAVAARLVRLRRRLARALRDRLERDGRNHAPPALVPGHRSLSLSIQAASGQASASLREKNVPIAPPRTGLLEVSCEECFRVVVCGNPQEGGNLRHMFRGQVPSNIGLT